MYLLSENRGQTTVFQRKTRKNRGLSPIFSIFSPKDIIVERFNVFYLEYDGIINLELILKMTQLRKLSHIFILPVLFPRYSPDPFLKKVFV